MSNKVGLWDIFLHNIIFNMKYSFKQYIPPEHFKHLLDQNAIAFGQGLWGSIQRTGSVPSSQ